MKQVFQDLSSGDIMLEDIPCPQLKQGSVLIQTSNTLISSGTEKMLLDFGRGGWLKKAQQQPDKVRMVLDKMKTDGVKTTLDAVKSKLDQPLPLGYCNAGIVLESSSKFFKVGDRVLSNGSHAEVVCVPENLCAKIPDGVSNEAAAFTVLGAIALQGIRLAEPTLGERVVVMGLGLIGLMAVQILRANGCEVLGVDFDSSRCDLAKGFGASTVNPALGENVLESANVFSEGHGVDAVIITASSKSNEPVHQAAEMSRKRGRIILVGVVGLELSRADFYEKELSFQVSCSYGPGRYDTKYEDKGYDYPLPYVRWTEQRNFEAVLGLMRSGAISVESLISKKIDLTEVGSAYDSLGNPALLGLILNYPSSSKALMDKIIPLSQNYTTAKNEDVSCAVIGAGNYASRILIPAFKNTGAELHTLVTSGGATASHHGKKNGFKFASTDVDEALSNERVNTVIIATRHNAHAQQTIDALKKGKHIFVEKPLALTLNELEEINETYQSLAEKPVLMLGFNRRFSPYVQEAKKHIDNIGQPKTFIMTMNAGDIPADHWVQDADVGGGRIIGEACHYIDLMRYLAHSPISSCVATSIGRNPGMKVLDDKASITLTFEDGSMGTIHYFSNGGSQFPKERIDIFCDNSVIQIDNFKNIKYFGVNGGSKIRGGQNKGQKECVEAFVLAVKGESKAPIAYDEIMEVSRVSIEAANMLRSS